MANSSPTVILTGCPNAGKTALFNRLTGSKQKVANYPGVTVEYKRGKATLPNGMDATIIDIPGTYSLHASSMDEEVARDILTGKSDTINQADMLVLVADATNLRLHIRFALEVRALGIPMVLALNMMDIAKRRGYRISTEALSVELGIPVVECVAVRNGNIADLQRAIVQTLSEATPTTAPPSKRVYTPASTKELRLLQQTANTHLKNAGVHYGIPAHTSYAIDRCLLHPVAGLGLLMLLMFFIFQSVFAWSALPMDTIDAALGWLGSWLSTQMPDGYIRSFVVDGVIAGIGSVVIFLPQILILFFFILLLEDSGYMARAAFLLDRIMGGVGLHGRAFIPLLSSYACAIPGIMATRTIPEKRDRFTTIMIAPLMTCSARIPVYTLLIAAFIPDQRVLGMFNLQGLVMFALYAGGLISGLAIAWCVKRISVRGPESQFIMELPSYKMPSPRNLLIGLMERAKIFLRRAGTIIFIAVIILWVLASFPLAPEGVADPVRYSYAGLIGAWLTPLFAPIGFSWEMVLALIPAMAAREVAVAALGTVYALGAPEAMLEVSLGAALAASWSLPQALAFLVWFIFAPQCISTLAIMKRELGSAKWMWAGFAYLTALAYICAAATYHIATAIGL
jgi:ferrous iron transport protein B